MGKPRGYRDKKSGARYHGCQIGVSGGLRQSGACRFLRSQKLNQYIWIGLIILNQCHVVWLHFTTILLYNKRFTVIFTFLICSRIILLLFFIGIIYNFKCGKVSIVGLTNINEQCLGFLQRSKLKVSITEGLKLKVSITEGLKLKV